MTTLKLYTLILNLVTATNGLAVRLRNEEIDKQDAIAEFKVYLTDALKEIE